MSKSTQKFDNRPEPCNKACTNGNAYRGYLCSCSKCKGTMHGSVNITFSMLEEVVDRKLLDPTISKTDFFRWQAIMQALLAQKPIRLKRAA